MLMVRNLQGLLARRKVIPIDTIKYPGQKKKTAPVYSKKMKHYSIRSFLNI